MEDEIQIPDGREFGARLAGDAIIFGTIQMTNKETKR
jgi:hypothetical protein